MSSTNNSNFTRGAQLWAHNIRMGLQGVKNICLFGLVFVFLLLAYRVSQGLTFESIYYFIVERYVQLKLAIGSVFYGKGQIGIDYYSLRKSMYIHSGAEQFVYQFWNYTMYGPMIVGFANWILQDALFEMGIIFVTGCVVAMILFNYRGRNILGTKKIRGSDIVTVKQLRRLLKKAKAASTIRIGGLPLVKDTETQHLLLTGTTGAGKTNMLNELLPQIRQKGERAIIIDVTGEFIDRFYNPETDYILNPLREESVNWLPWNDCHSDEEFNSLAATFVDGESIKTDRYWEDAARSVLSQALMKERDTKSIEAMLQIINRASLSEFCQYFSDTDAAGFVTKEAEKGTASVRSTLASKIEQLKLLKDGGEFSIKDWVNGDEDGGWLFINSTPNELDTLKPLISAWTNIAIKGILDRPHSSGNNKLWFVMDELPSMQKIPSLPTVLAQGRKYGACVVAGIQNISQLDRIYDRDGARELLDLFRTKFFFAVSDNNIAEYASKSLGEVEIDETKESLSYGSNTMRDGVNINSAQKMKRLVLPDEIKNLEARTCFVKLCGNYPVAKLSMDIQAPSKHLLFFYKLLAKKEKQESNVDYPPQSVEQVVTCKQAPKITKDMPIIEIPTPEEEGLSDQVNIQKQSQSKLSEEPSITRTGYLPEPMPNKKQQILSEIKD